MSAADLFVNSHDVDFRLRSTWIVVGNFPLFIRGLDSHSNVSKVLLYCTDIRGRDYQIQLGQLPLSAMTNCPHGYYEGNWFARAPARHRFQGLKGWSYWIVTKDGRIISNDCVGLESLLPSLILQPSVNKRLNPKARGVLTRDVFITNNDEVLVRGVKRGMYSNSRVLLDPMMPKYLYYYLNRAGLDWELERSPPEFDETMQLEVTF